MFICDKWFNESLLEIASLKKEHCASCCCCYSGFGRFKKEGSKDKQFYCFRCQFILKNVGNMDSDLLSWQLQIMALGAECWPDFDGEFQFSRYIQKRTFEIMREIHDRQFDNG